LCISIANVYRASDFRKDYGKLCALCALFPDVPCLAMTATASQTDMEAIKDSLGLKKCVFVVANPDRKNIYYEKIFRQGQDADSVKSILMPIAKDLLEKNCRYPITVVYLPLKLCGFAYRLFEYVLGVKQYYPHGSDPIPANRLFAQFHAPQTTKMKEEILKQLCSQSSIVRVIFATVAIGMGVDIPDIQRIIHIGPPCTVKAYIQETGRAGRDGNQSYAILYYNNYDISKNRVNMQDDMRNFCASDNICLRKLMLDSLDSKYAICMKPLHLCCSVCETKCKCKTCLDTCLEDI
jgi:superfamily II DNA helicase RecQ